MNHSFDVDIATHFGINVSVLLENIAHWTHYHSLNQTNFHEGRYWVYNTHDAFLRLFPYMTKKVLRGAINKCIAKGLLVKGRFNKKKYDRTTWYSLTDFALSLYKITPNYPQENVDLSTNNNGLNTEFCAQESSAARINAHMPSGAHPYALKGTPIPNINTGIEINNINVDLKKSTSERFSDYRQDERFMRFYNAYPKKQKPQDAWKAFISVVGNDDALLESILFDIREKSARHDQWQNTKYIPQPGRYLRSGDYESEIVNSKTEEALKKAEQKKKSDDALQERIKAQDNMAKMRQENRLIDARTKRTGLPSKLSDMVKRLYDGS